MDDGGVDRPFLTTKGACALLGVTLPTLYRYIESGELPAVRFGNGHWRINRDALLRMAECRREPDAVPA